MIESEAKEAKTWSRKTAKALKRMGYKWKPEPGQWACYRSVQGGISEPELITHYNGRQIELHRIGWLISARGLVPVFHWTRIVEILEGMGYKVWVEKHSDSEFTCTIAVKTDEMYERRVCRTEAKSRQEVMALATIALEEKEE